MLTPYHIVLSLETLGVSPNAVITQLAAVRIANGKIEQNVYHEYPNIKSCERCGLTTEGEVVLEWLQRAEEERKDKTMRRHRPDLKLALRLFTQWCKYPYDNTMFWLRSPAYGMGVLENAYDKCWLTVPWQRRNVHSLSTLDLVLATERVNIRFEPPAVRVNALSDAVADAEFLLKWLKHVDQKQEG